MNIRVDKYLSTLDRRFNTLKTYKWALECYFAVAGEELSDESYEKFLMSIKGMSSSTRSVMRSAVMGFYEFCEAGDLAKRERLNRHYARKERPGMVNFDREAIEKIISYCETLTDGLMELRDRAFVLTKADSGFRISELCALKRGDIDWREERVAIRGKGDKPAVVRLSKRSIKALQDYLHARQDLDAKTGKQPASLPLFAQHGNVSTLKPMSIDGMRKAVKQRMKEAGATVRLHDFRHYFVTMVVMATGNLKKAQDLARHESHSTTSRYAHFADSELDETYETIFNRREKNASTANTVLNAWKRE